MAQRERHVDYNAIDVKHALPDYISSSRTKQNVKHYLLCCHDYRLSVGIVFRQHLSNCLRQISNDLKSPLWHYIVRVLGRPTPTWRCYQTGAMIAGRIDWFGGYTGPCPVGAGPHGSTWHNITVMSRLHRNTTVLLDGRQLVQPIRRHQRRGHVGVVVVNGWDNTVYFDNLTLHKTTSGKIHITFTCLP